jgi:hypothetical protein
MPGSPSVCGNRFWASPLPHKKNPQTKNPQKPRRRKPLETKRPTTVLWLEKQEGWNVSRNISREKVFLIPV